MDKSTTLFLMTQKGLETLRSAVENDLDQIGAVVVGRDPATRNDYSSEIREVCAKYDLPCIDRSDHAAMSTEFGIAVSWRWLIPETASKIVVFHDSILPRYRGFNPLVSALINGDNEIGVTAFLATEEYDRGDIVGVEKIEIEYPIKIEEAIAKVSTCYGRLVSRILGQIRSGGSFDCCPQDEQNATYSLWRDEEDYKIDWTRSAGVLKRFIDATGFPYQGAQTTVNDISARVLEAIPVDDVRIENRTPGKAIFIDRGRPVVVCGSGLLMITEMVNEQTGDSLLPFRKIRSRFR